jgi:hypothetical protein
MLDTVQKGFPSYVRSECTGAALTGPKPASPGGLSASGAPGPQVTVSASVGVGVCVGQLFRSNTSSVEVADAYSCPAASVIRASANATRLPSVTTLPSARTGPVVAVSVRW